MAECRVVGWLAWVMVLGLAGDALASPFDVYGATARSSAMSGAQTATPEGAQAVYDNVAGLALMEPQLQVGTMATFGWMPILLKERPEGYDVPAVGSGSTALPTGEERNERRDTEGASPMYGITVGAVTDFGGTKTRGGVMVMLPTNGLLVLETHFSDERERVFSNHLRQELVASRIHRPVIEAGVARQLTERLSFGVGGTYLPGAAVGTVAYVRDPADQSDVALNADVETTSSWGLLVGLTAELPAGFTVGAAYRGEVEFRIEGANEIQVRGLDAGGGEEADRQVIDWVPVSSPSMMKAGVSYERGDVEVSLDGCYVFWSNYLDSQGESTNFRDGVEVRVGGEWQSAETTRLQAGAAFVPSPVPDQEGRTNYVDNSRLQASLGAGHLFEFSGRAFEASWFVQFQHLLRRDTNKSVRDDYGACSPGEEWVCDEVPDGTRDPRTGERLAEAQGLQTGNPGFPGFVSGGWIGALGLEIRY